MPPRPPSPVTRRHFLHAAAASSIAWGLPRARAQGARTAIAFALNRAPYDASNAPFLLANEKGYFDQEGIDVTFSLSKNATDAIRRVASNEFDFGFIDGSVSMRTAMQSKEPSPVYLFAIFDRSPACIVTWKASGIRKPADLVGKSIIATPGDGAFQMFQPFLRAAGIAPDAVRIVESGLEDREARMYRRQGDGAIGFDTTIYYKLREMGTKLEELSFMYYADGGLELYSNGIAVSRRMLRDRRERVAAVVRACARGWRDAIRNPLEAVDALAKVEPRIDKATEVERFEWIRERQVLTPSVRANGLGVVDIARVRRLAAQIAGPSGVPPSFLVEDVFDGGFLPALADRRVD
ncbi:MAG: ABC transporter substrate-binding protein [Usitatibacter sp.]